MEVTRHSCADVDILSNALQEKGEVSAAQCAAGMDKAKATASVCTPKGRSGDDNLAKIKARKAQGVDS